MTPDEIRAALHLLTAVVKQLRDAEELRSDGVWCGPDSVGTALDELLAQTFHEPKRVESNLPGDPTWHERKPAFDVPCPEHGK